MNNDWIGFTNKHPPLENKPLWYFFEYTGIGFGYFNGGSTFSGPLGFLNGDVTHWMYAPVAPLAKEEVQQFSGILGDIPFNQWFRFESSLFQLLLGSRAFILDSEQKLFSLDLTWLWGLDSETGDLMKYRKLPKSKDTWEKVRVEPVAFIIPPARPSLSKKGNYPENFF